MSEKGEVTKSSQSLIHIDGAALAEPARLLVEKACEAVGGLLRPWQIKRVGAAEADVSQLKAEAEAEAKVTHAMADVRVSTIQRRALERLAAEEAAKQENMESITGKALPLLQPDAKPQEMERDWLANFYDKSRLTSDEAMQELWAKILAGEANTPGKFSKRTVNLIGSLDKADAEHFQRLTAFVWTGIGVNGASPFIGNPNDVVFGAHGVTYASIMRLCEAGLTTFDTAPMIYGAKTGNVWFGPPVRVEYHGKPYALYPQPKERVAVGRVGLTVAGSELARLCRSEPILVYLEYVKTEWAKYGVRMFAVENGAEVPDYVDMWDRPGKPRQKNEPLS